MYGGSLATAPPHNKQIQYIAIGSTYSTIYDIARYCYYLAQRSLATPPLHCTSQQADSIYIPETYMGW